MLKHVFLFLGFLGSTLSWGLVAQTTVTLTVDMSNQTVSPDGVHVAGSFQGWDPGATPMTDNGDGTWSHTFTSDSDGLIGSSDLLNFLVSYGENCD